jgi:hypothetical protein
MSVVAGERSGRVGARTREYGSSMATSLVATGHLLYNSRHLCNASKVTVKPKFVLEREKFRAPLDADFSLEFLYRFYETPVPQRNSKSP